MSNVHQGSVRAVALGLISAYICTIHNKSFDIGFLFPKMNTPSNCLASEEDSAIQVFKLDKNRQLQHHTMLEGGNKETGKRINTFGYQERNYNHGLYPSAMPY